MHKKNRFLSVGPVVTALLVLALVIITAVNYYYRPKAYLADLIVKDVAMLEEIFKKIDDRCKILGFDSQKNSINFLNVGTFQGSEVGPMNLTYPTQWQGPYAVDNPLVQGIDYQIVKTKKGLFITPGEGVSLPNGKVIGKDIMLEEHADIAAMMKDEQSLLYDGKALATQIYLQHSEFQNALLQGVGTLDNEMVGARKESPVGVQLAMR